MTPALPPDDDDRTVIRPPAGGRGPMGHTLPVGQRLEGLEITGLIGEGGFGIVYLAYDASLDRQVAVKEYMPSSLAARAAGTWQVSVKSERHRDTFEAGLKSFVNEARLLARFDHPALVKVYRFWEANRTAYMAMPYYEGPTLKAVLAGLGVPPDEAQLRAWLRPLLDALSVMHKERCFHRDIAPDNILLTDRGPLLLDFGAARRVIGDMTHALTVVLKPGYAPIEQYGEAKAMVQGAWTDLYALAGVLHCAITGHAPMAAVERIMGDTMQPLAQRAAGRYSDGFLRAIDAALAVRPTERPQDVAQFRALLNVGLAPDSPELFRSSGFQPSGFGPSGFSTSGLDTLPPPMTAADLPTLSEVPVPAPVSPAAPAHAGQTVQPVATARPPRRALLALGGGLALLAAGGGVAWVLRRGAAAAPESPAAPLAEAPPAPATDPVPAPRPEAATPSAPPPADAAPPPVPAPLDPSPLPASPPAPAGESPAPAPAAVVATKPPPPRRSTPPAAAPIPRAGDVRPARCSDILQKASLEPLSAEEADYLKRECR